MNAEEIYETWINGNLKDAKAAIEAAPCPVAMAAHCLEIARGQSPNHEFRQFNYWLRSWPGGDLDA